MFDYTCMLSLGVFRIWVVIMNFKGSFTCGKDSELWEFDINDALVKLVWGYGMD